MGGTTDLVRFNSGIVSDFWRISDTPRNIVGNKNTIQTRIPQTRLKPSARVKISRKTPVAIARVLKDIEYRAIENKRANKPHRKTNIFTAVSSLPGRLVI
jgi:hypothetical protein